MAMIQKTRSLPRFVREEQFSPINPNKPSSASHQSSANIINDKLQAFNSIRAIKEYGIKITITNEIKNVLEGYKTFRTKKESRKFPSNKFLRKTSIPELTPHKNVEVEQRHVSAKFLEMMRNRKLQVFANVYDSFNSSQDEQEYNYSYYIPKWYSIDKSSESFRFYLECFDKFLYLLIIFFSTEIMVLSEKNAISKTALVFSSIFELGLSVNFIIRYFFVSYTDPTLLKQNYQIMQILKYRFKRNYFKFFFDLYHSIPLTAASYFYYIWGSISEPAMKDQILYFLCTRVSLVLYLFKWIHIMSLIEERENGETKEKRNFFNDPKLKILLFFVAFLHITASLWLFFGINTQINLLSDNSKWIYYYNYVDSDISFKYVISLYFTVTTLFTVGYGDIVPHNSTERVYVIVCLIFGCLIYSFLISVISIFLSPPNSKKLLVESKILALKKLGEEFNLSLSLQKKVERSILNHYENWHGDKEDLLKNLPNSLKISLQLCLYDSVLNRIKYCSRVENKKFLLDFASKLHMMKLSKGEVIIAPDDKIEEMFFVNNGFIMIKYQPKLENISNFDFVNLAKFSTENYYGDIMMLTKSRSRYLIDVGSVSSEVITLSKNDFITLNNAYKNIMADFLSSSYESHYFVELKRKSIDYYYKVHFGCEGFETIYRSYLNKVIYNQIFNINNIEPFCEFLENRGSIEEAKTVTSQSPCHTIESKCDESTSSSGWIRDIREDMKKSKYIEKKLKTNTSKISQIKHKIIPDQLSNSIKKKFKEDNTFSIDIINMCSTGKWKDSISSIELIEPSKTCPPMKFLKSSHYSNPGQPDNMSIGLRPMFVSKEISLEIMSIKKSRVKLKMVKKAKNNTQNQEVKSKVALNRQNKTQFLSKLSHLLKEGVNQQEPEKIDGKLCDFLSKTRRKSIVARNQTINTHGILKLDHIINMLSRHQHLWRIKNSAHPKEKA